MVPVPPYSASVIPDLCTRISSQKKYSGFPWSLVKTRFLQYSTRKYQKSHKYDFSKKEQQPPQAGNLTQLSETSTTEQSQNTILLASTQAVYKALHSTVQRVY